MLRRSLTAAGLMLAGSLILAGSSARAAEPTIALVTINQQALFFNQMNDGAKEAAKEAGAKLVIFNANNDPAAQNNAIETYIQQKVNGLIVVAIDVNGIMPAVKQAARPASRSSPSMRCCPRARRRRRSASTTRAPASRSARSSSSTSKAHDGREGQARHRRRAQLLHPEPAPEGIRGHDQGRQRA